MSRSSRSQRRRGLRGRRPRGAGHRREPARGRRRSCSRRARHRRRASASRSSTRRTSSSPGSRSRSPSMPACSTSAARARPISAGLGAALVCAPFRLPAGLYAGHRRHHRRGRCSARPAAFIPASAGQARQPHRHHDDHVQFHRLRAHGLPARQRAAQARAR